MGIVGGVRVRLGVSQRIQRRTRRRRVGASVSASGWRRLVPFSLAAVPPSPLIPAYSWACFGDLFDLAGTVIRPPFPR